MQYPTPEQLEEATNGRYRVEKLIGIGGMGAVYRGTHRQLNVPVALKVMAPEFRTLSPQMKRFSREAAVSARLSHSNLVLVIDSDLDGEFPYIVMKYVEGGTLETRLREKGPLSYADTMSLVEDVGSALVYIHDHHVIHRDIKPANILYHPDTKRWMVADLGIARTTSFDDTDITHTHQGMGTPAYWPPEQARNAKDVDGRADLYSFAVVLYEAVTGRLPTGLEPAKAAHNLKRATGIQLSSSLAHALMAPLASDRDERPASVEDWLRGVHKKAGRKRIGALWVGAAAVVTALLALGLTDILRTPPGPRTTLVAVFPVQFTETPDTPGLESILPETIASQVRALPGVRVLAVPLVRAEVTRRFGALPSDLDSLLALAGSLGASHVLSGTATSSGRLLTSLRVALHDIEGELLASGETSGPLDSMHAMVGHVVRETVVDEIVNEDILGYASALPRGPIAIPAYYNGIRAFKRSEFGQAIAHFDTVIAQDSTYAPAHLRRALARYVLAQPTEASSEIASALEAVAAAERQRDNLDAIWKGLLDGYSNLFRDGDLKGARESFRQVSQTYPESADAWFMRGVTELQFSVGGWTLQEARYSLRQAVRQDPSFAIPHAFLFWIALLDDDKLGASEARDAYLRLDNSSAFARLIQIADTLANRPLAAMRIIVQFPRLDSWTLENIAKGAGELHAPPGTRPSATNAIDTLFNRTKSPVHFRMRLATYLGSGQPDLAVGWLARGPAYGVPEREIHQWTVLGEGTMMTALGTDEAAVSTAKQGLLQSNDFVSVWMVGRAARARREAAIVEQADSILSTLRASGMLERSLLLDLEAVDARDAGETQRALELWETATSRYDVERMGFGAVASLWPLRADYARLAASNGQYEIALRLARSFHRMSGFVDQVVWEAVLLAEAEAARATGDLARVNFAHASLVRAYRAATGVDQLRIRDSLDILLTSGGG